MGRDAPESVGSADHERASLRRPTSVRKRVPGAVDGVEKKRLCRVGLREPFLLRTPLARHWAARRHAAAARGRQTNRRLQSGEPVPNLS